jgi:hypothetical protein
MLLSSKQRCFTAADTLQFRSGSSAASTSAVQLSISRCRCSRPAFQHFQYGNVAELPYIECSNVKTDQSQSYAGLYPEECCSLGKQCVASSSAPAFTSTSSGTSSSSSSSSCRADKRDQGDNRRQLLLHSTLAPFLVQLVLGSDDATTIVNSVLSAYGELC